MSINDHADAVQPHHRFGAITSNGSPWDLSHLEAFTFKVDPGLGFELVVVVLFSSHCFTRSVKRDGRMPKDIPAGELYDDGRECRVLDEERYTLSRQFLPRLVRELGSRRIQVADPGRNFFTFELIDQNERRRNYAVFFEADKDNRRAKRMFLRIQSAYTMDKLSNRQAKARKVRFDVLLKATYEGRKIRG